MLPLLLGSLTKTQFAPNLAATPVPRPCDGRPNGPPPAGHSRHWGRCRSRARGSTLKASRESSRWHFEHRFIPRTTRAAASRIGVRAVARIGPNIDAEGKPFSYPELRGRGSVRCAPRPAAPRTGPAPCGPSRSRARLARRAHARAARRSLPEGVDARYRRHRPSVAGHCFPCVERVLASGKCPSVSACGGAHVSVSYPSSLTVRWSARRAAPETGRDHALRPTPARWKPRPPQPWRDRYERWTRLRRRSTDGSGRLLMAEAWDRGHGRNAGHGGLLERHGRVWSI